MKCRVSIFVLALLGLGFMSCGGGSVGETYDLRGFQTDDIGGGATYASFVDQSNWPLSSGHVIHGVQNGVWTTFHPNSNKIKGMANYINGRKNGPEVTLNDRGYMESRAEYKNDQLHGLSAKYKNGRTMSETSYANGVMHGPFTVFDENTGKIQRSGSFKNGQQHGELLFYNGDGVVTLRYQYEDGEKVSGGIVEEE